MELKELAREIAEAVTYGHEHSRQKNAEQQSRWFDIDEKTGVKTMRRETHNDGFGENVQFAVIAFENIHDLVVTRVEIELCIPEVEVDEKKGLSKLLVNLFSDENKEKPKREINKITVTTEKIDPPPGLKILQRMATREVLQYYHANYPNLAYIVLKDELGEPTPDSEPETTEITFNKGEK